MQIRQIVVAEERGRHSPAAVRKNHVEAAEKKFSLFRNYKPDADLPWVRPKDSAMLAPLENAPVGLYGKILKSHVGYHIVKVVRTRKDAIQSFAALRPTLEKEYKEKKAQQVYLQWLHDRVKTEAATIDEPRLRALTAEYQETF